MNFSNAIGLFIKLFLLLTPFFILSVFLATCAGMSRSAQRSLALRTSFAVWVATVILYLFGELIFRYLGITLDAFRIGAGLVLMLNGIEMVRSSGVPTVRSSPAGPGDPAVVPLAIPTTVGPGTIGTLIVMGVEVQSWSQRLLELGAITLAVGCVGGCLYFSDYLEHLLKNKGISILTKLTGMYIVALAAQIIFTGVGNMIRNV